MSLSINNKTRQKVPRVKFEQIKDEILGKNYELSLVFCGHALSRRLNKSLRDKNKPTNVLSFSLTKKSGEIFVNLTKAHQEMKKFDMNFLKFVAYLFIHGSLHLKGMAHGAKMDMEETKLLSKFDKIFNGTSNRSRN